MSEIHVLDASALLRWLDDEEGGTIVRDILRAATKGECKVLLSAINWGEVIDKLSKRLGAEKADRIRQQLLSHESFEVEGVSGTISADSAVLAVELKMSYADAFGVELTKRLTDATLVTADFGAKAAGDLIPILFLAPKQTPRT